MTWWSRVPSEVWEEVIEAMPRPLSRDVCAADLAHLRGLVEAGRLASVPSRAMLGVRWGLSEKQARGVIERASEGPAKGQPRAEPERAAADNQDVSGQRRASEGPAKGQGVPESNADPLVFEGSKNEEVRRRSDQRESVPFGPSTAEPPTLSPDLPLAEATAAEPVAVEPAEPPKPTPSEALALAADDVAAVYLACWTARAARAGSRCAGQPRTTDPRKVPGREVLVKAVKRHGPDAVGAVIRWAFEAPGFHPAVLRGERPDSTTHYLALESLLRSTKLAEKMAHAEQWLDRGARQAVPPAGTRQESWGTLEEQAPDVFDLAVSLRAADPALSIAAAIATACERIDAEEQAAKVIPYPGARA